MKKKTKSLTLALLFLISSLSLGMYAAAEGSDLDNLPAVRSYGTFNYDADGDGVFEIVLKATDIKYISDALALEIKTRKEDDAALLNDITTYSNNVKNGKAYMALYINELTKNVPERKTNLSTDSNAPATYAALTSSIQSVFDAGVITADTRLNTSSASYPAGVNTGRSDAKGQLASAINGYIVRSFQRGAVTVAYNTPDLTNTSDYNTINDRINKMRIVAFEEGYARGRRHLQD